MGTLFLERESAAAAKHFFEEEKNSGFLLWIEKHIFSSSSSFQGLQQLRCVLHYQPQEKTVKVSTKVLVTMENVIKKMFKEVQSLKYAALRIFIIGCQSLVKGEL